MKYSPLLPGLALVTLLACGGTKEEPSAPSTKAPEPTASQEARSEPSSPADEEASKPPASNAASETEPSRDSTAPAEKTETRTTTVIQEIVKQHRGTVRECYKKAAKEQPGIAGNLTIAFTIDPKGKVTEAKVNPERSDLRVPELDACAIDVILKLEFPASSRGRESSVNYPFNFTPGNH